MCIHRLDEFQQFRFEVIELFKSENLGAGSYGVVCKAKCDNLLCAAKIIYPILLEAQDTSLSVLASSHLSPIQRFERECQVLSQINHPNIVQYLQTHRDPETGSSILLMELMDENLTHFLQSYQSPVPEHIRVTICHGIALALCFLHGNGVIHRDLSANNILINNKIHAKVTDFGMSMFTDSSGSRTLCPGTVNYMPPEALNDPPVHSEKLDCFSFGVCVVQICTRLWPDPKPRFSTYLVPDPRDSSKKTEAQFAVPEIERRESHLKMIDGDDILRPIALDCLEDNPEKRPTASEICIRIEALIENNDFTQSRASTSEQSNTAEDQLRQFEADHTRQLSLLEKEIQRLRKTVDEAHQDIQEKNQMLDIRARQLQKVSLSLAEKERENDRLKASIMQEGDSKTMQNEIIESLERELQEKEREIIRLEQQMEVQNQTIRDQQYITKNEDYQIKNMQFDLTSKVKLIQRLTQQLDQATSEISEKNRALMYKKRELRSTEDLMQSKFQSFQDTLRIKDKRIQDLEEYLATNEEHLAALQKELHKFSKINLREGKKSKPRPIPRFKKDGKVHTYKSDQLAPMKMHAGSVASLGSCIFFRPYETSEICKFDYETNRWTPVLPNYSERGFTLAVADDALCCIGGRGCRKVRTLVTVEGISTWYEGYPEMLEERANSCVVSTPDVLIVAGGLKADYSTIASVEVLRFHSRLWASVASLPYPLHGSCATVCGDRVFLGGGYFMKSKSLFSTLTCSLSALLAPPSTVSKKSASFPRDLDKKTWHHTADLPVCRASFTTLYGELFAIGGKKSDLSFSNQIHKYSILNNRWEEVSHMEMARSNCLVGDLGNKIIAVGGLCEEGISNDIEFIFF